MSDKLLTSFEMAQRLNRCKKTFAKYVRAYEIPHIKLGRDMLFDEAEVIAFLKNLSQQPQTAAARKGKRTIVHAAAERSSEFAGVLSRGLESPNGNVRA